MDTCHLGSKKKTTPNTCCGSVYNELASKKWWLGSYFPFGKAYFQVLCEGGHMIFQPFHPGSIFTDEKEEN